MMGITIPWKSKTKQGMVFSMIHVKDSLLPRDKVWSLDFLGICINIQDGIALSTEEMESQ